MRTTHIHARTIGKYDKRAFKYNVISVDGQSSFLINPQLHLTGLKTVAGYSKIESSKKRQCWGEIKAYLVEGYNLYWKASGNRLRC